MEVKDLINISDAKYNIMYNLYKEFIPKGLVSLEKVIDLQNELNIFWPVISNKNGFYLKDPGQKIGYICDKFEERCNFMSNRVNRTFEIKISCDSTNISKKHTQLLNFTFNLLNDEANNSNVSNIFILGN